MKSEEQVKRENPWVKVSVKKNGEVSVIGEGFNNPIEIIACLQLGIGILNQQMVEQSRLVVPGIPQRGPFPRG